MTITRLPFVVFFFSFAVFHLSEFHVLPFFVAHYIYNQYTCFAQKLSASMLKSVAQSNDTFRIDFIYHSFTNSAHGHRYTRNSVVNSLKNICAPEPVKTILKQETNKHHHIGSLSDKNRSRLWYEYDHLGLINAACEAAGLPAYTVQCSKMQELVHTVTALNSEYNAEIQKYKSQIASLKQELKQTNDKNTSELQKIQLEHTSHMAQWRQLQREYNLQTQQLQIANQTIMHLINKLRIVSANVILEGNNSEGFKVKHKKLKDNYESQIRYFRSEIRDLQSENKQLKSIRTHNDAKIDKLEKLNDHFKTLIEKYENDLLVGCLPHSTNNSKTSNSNETNTTNNNNKKGSKNNGKNSNNSNNNVTNNNCKINDINSDNSGNVSNNSNGRNETETRKNNSNRNAANLNISANRDNCKMLACNEKNNICQRKDLKEDSNSDKSDVTSEFESEENENESTTENNENSNNINIRINITTNNNDENHINQINHINHNHHQNQIKVGRKRSLDQTFQSDQPNAKKAKILTKSQSKQILHGKVCG